jgi:hypothetical protein
MLVTCVVCMCSSAMTVIVRTAVTAALNVAYLCSCVCVCVYTWKKGKHVDDVRRVFEDFLPDSD